MKELCGKMLVLLICFAFSGHVWAQHSITPYGLNVTFSKTTNLIFPYGIKSVDRGSASVIVQKAKGVENILQVKAARRNFEQTNISVVTSDGKFYSFLVGYNNDPAILNIEFGKTESKDSIAFLSNCLNESTLDSEATAVDLAGHFIHLSAKSEMLRVQLTGIYLGHQTMWLKLHLKNGSQIDFKPGYTRFFLRDKKKSKRTAIQKTELIPVYTSGNKILPGDSSRDMEVAFYPFTVPKTQQLIIQMSEGSGGRFIELKVRAKTILKAKKLKSCI